MLTSGDRFDRQAGGLPFGIAVLEPADEIAASPERRHRLEGENAIWAAAIGDDLPVCRKLAQATFQLGKRNVECAGKMSDRKLILGRTSRTVTRPSCSLETRSSRDTGSSASRARK